MAYRAPVRTQGFAGRRFDAMPATSPSIFDAVNGMSGLSRIMQELETLKAAHEKEIASFVDEAKAQIAAELERVRAIKKGDRGELPLMGVHYSIPTPHEIIDAVMARMPAVRHGKDADEQKIVARVLSEVPTTDEIVDVVLRMIKVPESKPGEDGKDADPTGIIDEVIRQLTDGRRLKIEHVDGLQSKIDNVSRSASAQWRGGGDTVVAGSNITITKNSAGRKVITSTGGATLTTPPETPDGSRTTFTFATSPTAIVADGTTYFLGQGYTYTGTTATLTVAPTQYIRAYL